MNIAVGKISDEARTAIERAGGRIEGTLKPGVLMVTLPETADGLSSGKDHIYITLTRDAETILHFTRAWHTEDCSIDLCK